MGVQPYLWLGMALVVTWAGRCHGHGRLIDPPSRASAWRFGFNTPRDYNDNEGFCGGFSHQYYTQDGKCGICGDAWDENPRPHEAGGVYATGTIVRTYTQGQVITAAVEITANHKGYFEFRICPNNNPDMKASQTCLNEHPLFAVDGSTFQHYIDTKVGLHEINLKLPDDLNCTQCVLQWRYVAGNNWGTCEDGKGQVGCGPQEEFRACADVTITGTNGGGGGGDGGDGGDGGGDGGDGGDGSVTTTTTTTTTKLTTVLTSTPRPPTTTTQGNTENCRAVGLWQNVPGMNDWCMTNCNFTPRYCPDSHCTCD